MKGYLKLSSVLFILVLLGACSSPYKHLNSATPQRSVLEYKPQFEKVLYRCIVNGGFLWKKYHLSGLLLFKTMDNGTVRAVFQNEMGATFFDFEWDKKGQVSVISIIEQLDKPAVVKVLQKDLSLLLMNDLSDKKEFFYTLDRGKELYSCFKNDKGMICYIREAQKLERIEEIGKRNKITTIKIDDKQQSTSMPDKVLFDHHKAKFTIELTKITANVNE